MRVMVLVKASPMSEAGQFPADATEKLLADMGRYNEELVSAGIMVSGEGLKPSEFGVRVRFSGKERAVTNGPFAESRELVAGFWIWNVKSMDEAIEWVKKSPNPMPDDSDIEIRPIAEFEDFGDAMTPELRAREEAMRDQLEREA